MHLENKLGWIYKVDKPVNLCDMQNYLSFKRKRRKKLFILQVANKKVPKHENFKAKAVLLSQCTHVFHTTWTPLHLDNSLPITLKMFVVPLICVREI